MGDGRLNGRVSVRLGPHLSGCLRGHHSGSGLSQSNVALKSPKYLLLRGILGELT